MFIKFVYFIVPLFLFLYQVKGRLNNAPVLCCPNTKDHIEARSSKNPSDFKVYPALPDDPQCGISISDSSRKGSKTAGREEFPWVARLRYNDTLYKCEGVLISSRYILTSEECLEDYGKLINIRLGGFNCSKSDKDCKEPLDVQIGDSCYKLGYSAIYLVELKEEITFSDTVRPICLPKPGEKPLAVGDVLVENGWNMNGTQLKTENRQGYYEDCPKDYDYKAGMTNNKYICARSLSGEACLDKGISGGFLIKWREQEKAYLEGVLKYRCRSGSTNIYTDVRPILEWIQKKIKSRC